ncbi:MAG: murein biosynthesis integral membrane protein MurJ [Phycisphaerales bacterium]|nr:murein biosynthesis integral membrane protein MurJ [Phycisphaerales bacterium]
MLGLLREHAYSRFFGASPLLSAFRIAFQIPNLARRLFGEGALTSSFIPVFTSCRANEGEDAARQLAGATLTLLATALLVMLVVAEAVLLALVWIYGGPTLSLTALVMPYMLLICLTAFFAGILNALNRFAAPAAAPMILNVVIISATWIGGKLLHLSEYTHLRFVAASVLLAGVLQLATQLVWLRRCGFRSAINFNWRTNAVRRIVTMMAPMIVGMSALQINTFIDSMIAFFLVPDGKGPAILGYAQYMSNLPLGIFSTALATAIFPLLAKHVAERNHDAHLRSVEAGLRTSLFISIPAGAGLMLIATPLVRLLFESKEFLPDDTHRVVLALNCYCAGIWAYAMHQMLVRAFHSVENSKTPVRIALVMLVLNFMLNIVLVRTALRESGVALATALTAGLQAFVLAYTLNKHLPGLRWRQVTSSAMRSLLATCIMAAAIAALRGIGPISAILPANDAVQLCISIPVGAVIYLLVTRMLGMQEGAIILRRSKPE